MRPAFLPLVALGTTLVLVGCSGTTTPAPSPTGPQASASSGPDVVDPGPGPTDPPVEPVRAVGGLFLPSSTVHYCTAAVVHSTSGAVVVTAAHCLAGTGVGLRFVPGYGRSGSGPAGSWVVTAAYAQEPWLRSRDVADDYVFLRVDPGPTSAEAPRGRPQTVEGAVGSVGTPGPLAAGQSVSVRGYTAGHNDAQLACTATTRTEQGQPTVDCPAFGIGSSGAPWVATPESPPRAGGLVGLIGGFRQGGCLPDTSYSPSFDATTAALLARADAGGPGDTLPLLGDDGC